MDPLTYVRLFTHVFVHSNWSHFRNNFLTILLIGPMIEEKYGTMNLLYMFLITAGIMIYLSINKILKTAISINKYIYIILGIITGVVVVFFTL